jgi:hypothetical protein
MIPIEFPEQNVLFTHGPGYNLCANDNGDYITSCWQLNKDDLERINKNGGKLWLRVKSRYQPPVHIQVVNPFSYPDGILVPLNVVDRVGVIFYDDTELLVLMGIPPSYHSFKIEKEEDEYRVVVKDRNFGDDQEFVTEFIFFEEVRMIGLVSAQYGSYDEVARHFKVAPETTLLLERVNSTIK